MKTQIFYNYNSQPCIIFNNLLYKVCGHKYDKLSKHSIHCEGVFKETNPDRKCYFEGDFENPMEAWAKYWNGILAKREEVQIVTSSNVYKEMTVGKDKLINHYRNLSIEQDKELKKQKLEIKALKAGYKSYAGMKLAQKREKNKEYKAKVKEVTTILKKHLNEYFYIDRNWTKSGKYLNKQKDTYGFSKTPTRHATCIIINKTTISGITSKIINLSN